MKISWTKKELIEALKDFNDDDEILINIHDDVFYDDNYQFYLDPIHMGLDDKDEDRGHQIWLCPVQNKEIEEVTTEQALEKLKHFYELDLDNCEMTNESWVKELAKASSTTHRHSYWNNFLNIEYKQYLKEREGKKHITSVKQETINKINHLDLRSDLENDNIYDTFIQADGKTHSSPENFTISCLTKDEEWVTDYHYDSKTEYEQDVKLLNI